MVGGSVGWGSGHWESKLLVPAPPLHNPLWLRDGLTWEMRSSNPGLRSSCSNAEASALETITPSLVLPRGRAVTESLLLDHLLSLSQDCAFPAGKDFLRCPCTPWTSQAAWHLESAQLIKFDIWVASRRALDRLRKAAAAVITSLWAEEPTPILLQLDPCSQLAPPLTLRRAHYPLWWYQKTEQITPWSAFPAAVTGFETRFLEALGWVQLQHLIFQTRERDF